MDTVSHWPFRKQITFTNAYGLSDEDTWTYSVDILIKSDPGSDETLCTCPIAEQTSYLNFDYSQWVAAYAKEMYIRVAVEEGGVLSDYVPYMEMGGTGSTCGLQFQIDSKSNPNCCCYDVKEISMIKVSILVK